MFRWKNVRNKLWVVCSRRIYLFLNQIKQIFLCTERLSLRTSITPNVYHSERLSLRTSITPNVYHSECQAFSCTQEKDMENFWEKPEMLLKFFIHHTRSLVILLISSINSLQCTLSSCSELVSSTIGTNKHIRYQSIRSEIYTFIAVQAAQVYYKASRCFTYVALSASSLGRIACCLAHGHSHNGRVRDAS